MPQYSLNTPYLVLIGLVLIALVLVFLQYQPMIRQINEMRSDVQTLRASVAERQAFLEAIDRKRAELASYQEHERRLEVILPLQPQLEDVVRIIHTASQTAGGRLLQFVNQSESVKQDLNAQQARGDVVGLPEAVQPLAAKVEFSGSYSQLRAFLEQLTTSARLIDATHLAISSGGDQPDLLQLDASLRFYQFVSK